MKHKQIYIAILALILASLACQTMLGGGNSSSQEELPPYEYSDDTYDYEYEEPSIEEPEEFEFSFSGESDFPMPDDAKNVTNIAGVTNFQTKLSLEEALDFYRAYYEGQGLKEREITTVISDGVFSIVFDGDSSGQAVVIQGVDLGDGSVNISIRLEDI